MSNDPLQTLQAALAVPADSEAQASLLQTLRENLEAQPTPIPILCSTLIKTVTGAGDSLLKRWVIDLVYFALGRSSLSFETRTQLAVQSLDVLAGLLHDPNTNTVKTVIGCFAAVYPLLFRHLCTNRQLRPMWETLSSCKTRILELVWSQTAKTGVKLAALKFMQRVILVQTRGVSDPRLQKQSDPNLSFCPVDHPFISVSTLEAEGAELIKGVVTIFYTSPNADLVAAVVNSWGPLAKLRPSQTAFIVSALASWAPNALSSLPASQIRSVEKSVRILMINLSRSQNGGPYTHQLNEALVQQSARMEQAAANERNRKATEAAEASRKRSLLALQNEASEAKRMKLSQPDANVSGVLANFDFASLPSNLVTELIVANLQVLTDHTLTAAIQAYRQANGPPAPAPQPEPAPTLALAQEGVSQRTETPAVVKAEPIDPLQMDIEEEELDYEPEKINIELSKASSATEAEGEEIIDIDEALRMSDYRIPPPSEIDDEQRAVLIKSSFSRIWDNRDELTPPGEGVDRQPGHGTSVHDLSVLLLIRMATRLSEPEENQGERGEQSTELSAVSRQERVRQALFDYVMTDFQSREKLAILWMNEEWYNDRLRVQQDSDWYQNYPVWLQKILNSYEARLDAKDRTFSRFLLDIPHVPQDVLQLLRELCLEPDRMQVGFTTLREFAVQRPPLRGNAMKVLLDLTTHSEKVTRNAAIITVKRWVPDIQPMNEMVRTFALRLLRRLQQKPANSDISKNSVPKDEQPVEIDMDSKHVAAPEHKVGNGDISKEVSAEDMEDGEMPQEEIVQTEYLGEKLEIPAVKAQVLQHVELPFALCVKDPEILDEIFDAYGQMEKSVQEAVQDLITQLIRSLGPNHPRLSLLMRTFPTGADTLALRVLTIFTENARPTPAIVALVKGLMAERELDARFLIPIIAEMDKADIMRHLPHIVSTLNGTPETKALVKSVFESVVTTPPQTFGSVTSNLPRVRQSELLTPAELMVLLHESEKEIGLKSAIEAIGICFSMTDVFRSEILAVVMQQIVDEQVLPVLFLRTVIQAVTTYKSLVGFVSTTLLSRLITKKIWTNPPLWEGFIRCAKAIAPASFGALLQLPKDQLRELLDKQPGLKAGLREYVLKKAGNKARQAGFLDLFGDDQSQSPVPQPQAVPASTA